ncbi:hypothetical protein OAI02_01635 [Candidatus Pseudothioglobus singularis]|nr:hypothetical protein [Candidatus Pseudothioglobus singularis]MDB4847182.1 hypothetical protein [Candidatus Pseudothioglobus singularis]
MSPYSVEKLINVIKKLPADKEVPSGTQGYSRYHSQKAHWLGWLSKKPGAKYYRQDAPNRGAKFVYNHIMEPKMLLWLITASGVDNKLVANAQKDSDNARTMASSCAAIRKVVSWEDLELIISNK